MPRESLATTLGVSESTVRTQLTVIFDRMRVQGFAELLFELLETAICAVMRDADGQSDAPREREPRQEEA